MPNVELSKKADSENHRLMIGFKPLGFGLFQKMQLLSAGYQEADGMLAVSMFANGIRVFGVSDGAQSVWRIPVTMLPEGKPIAVSERYEPSFVQTWENLFTPKETASPY